MKNYSWVLKFFIVINFFMMKHTMRSQSPPFYPYTTPPAIITGNYNVGIIRDSSVNVLTNNLQVSGAADYDVKARYYIHFPQGNYALASAMNSGTFHAHIQPPQIEVVSYHPNGFTGIPMYDKFERLK